MRLPTTPLDSDRAIRLPGRVNGWPVIRLKIEAKLKMKIPSDLKILTEIYERYYDEFKSFSREEPTRACKVYVPIAIRAIAADLKTDEYILFGRLYNHLSKKYEFKDTDGASSPLFSPKVGEDKHAIHFPLLASIIAGLQEEDNRQNTTWKISITAALISLISLGIAGFNAWTESNKKTVQYNLSQETIEQLKQINLKQKQ